MADLSEVGKALFGDEDSEVVKSGTLAVTRLTGWISAAGLVITNTELFGNLDASQKLWGSIAAVAIVAFIAAADALARGFVTAHSQPRITALDNPLTVSRPSLQGAEESGWKIFLVRHDPNDRNDIEFWVVRRSQAEWVKSRDIRPG